jgi:hypothetical protein
MERQIQLDMAKDVFWIGFRHEKCSNSLPQSMRDLVAHWWPTQTIVSPIAKNVIRPRIGMKLDEMHLAQC